MYLGDGTQDEGRSCHFPYFVVINSQDTDTIHTLGMRTLMRNQKSESWVPKQARFSSLYIQHMKMYRTLKEEMGHQGSKPKEWKQLGFIGLGQITAYSVELEDGSVDIVLARSKVCRCNCSDELNVSTSSREDNL